MEYLNENIKGLQEIIKELGNNEDIIYEIKRVEGMFVFAYHHNMISAIEYSGGMDELQDIENNLY